MYLHCGLIYCVLRNKEYDADADDDDDDVSVELVKA